MLESHLFRKYNGKVEEETEFFYYEKEINENDLMETTFDGFISKLRRNFRIRIRDTSKLIVVTVQVLLVIGGIIYAGTGESARSLKYYSH